MEAMEHITACGSRSFNGSHIPGHGQLRERNLFVYIVDTGSFLVVTDHITSPIGCDTLAA